MAEAMTDTPDDLVRQDGMMKEINDCIGEYNSIDRQPAEFLRLLAGDVDRHGHATCYEFNRAADLLEQQAARIAKLEARLEIDHAFRWNPDAADETERFEIPASKRDDFPDGITCRDATIGLLEDRIAALEAENARLRNDERVVESALFHWFECEHGACGHQNEAMEKLALSEIGQRFRQYRERIGHPFEPSADALKPAEEPAEC